MTIAVHERDSYEPQHCMAVIEQHNSTVGFQTCEGCLLVLSYHNEKVDIEYIPPCVWCPLKLELTNIGRQDTF